jgi:hypothetical protein
MAKTRIRLFAFGLITAGFLVVVLGIVVYFSSGTGKNPDTPLIPHELVALPLARLNTGQEALFEINQLHGRTFPLTAGAVGRYGMEDEATIWVAETADEAAAKEILLAMRDRISEGNSPFTPTSELQTGNRNIYMLDGLGQKHFYFQSRNLIVWAAADTPLYERVVAQVLSFYP